MEFRILGPLEVVAGQRPVEVGGARTRAVLAMLLVHANQVVSAARLIDELWPGMSPDKALASLQVRLSELRRALRAADEDGRLVTQPPGYLLRVAPADFDVARFEQLAGAGNAALAGGDAGTAVRQFDAALASWRGVPLPDLDMVPSIRDEIARLTEARTAVAESRIDALLQCGRHREVIADLEALTAAHPLRERIWSQLMLALYRAGRQADALTAYRKLHTILAGELGIEPGPATRDLHARILGQDPALDSRRGTVHAAPATRYVESQDGVHIAYQVLGSGARDIVFVPGLMSHLELLWEDPETAGFFQRLATLGRLIMFDKRDTGLSDRAAGNSSLEERIGDVQAVLRAVGSGRHVLFGYSEGAPMSILLAAAHPEQVSALILGSASARWSPAPDYPCGPETVRMFETLTDIAATRWGQGETIEWYLPSRADSPRARELFARFERMAISPSAFLGMSRMIRKIDVRDVLPSVRVPTLVIQRLGDRITPPWHGRYLASHIAGARYFEQPGDHSLRFAGGGDDDALHREIADFLATAGEPTTPDRVLATILLVSGTADQVRRHRGRVVRTTDRETLATFDAPGQAIRCAVTLRDEAAAAGCSFRAGIHTGEVDLLGNDISGTSVRIAAHIAALARPGEVLVSRTVKDLVAGTDIGFTDCGSHELDDLPDSWQLFAATAGL